MRVVDPETFDMLAVVDWDTSSPPEPNLASVPVVPARAHHHPGKQNHHVRK